MGKTIAIVNQKGGMGKTTTTDYLAKSLAKNMNKVLVVDFDPLSDIQTRYDIPVHDILPLSACLEGTVSIERCVYTSNECGIALAIGGKDLIGFEIAVITRADRESMLARQIEDVKSDYDYILIDTPSSLGLLTMNAMVAADEVIIPIKCDYNLYEGMAELLRTLNDVRNTLNERLAIAGFLITHVNPQLRSAVLNVKDIRICYGDHVFKTLITDREDLTENYEQLATELLTSVEQ